MTPLVRASAVIEECIRFSTYEKLQTFLTATELSGNLKALLIITKGAPVNAQESRNKEGIITFLKHKFLQRMHCPLATIIVS
jgi:hypothetical protein